MIDFENLEQIKEYFDNEHDRDCLGELGYMKIAIRLLTKTCIEQQEQIDYLSSLPYSTEITPDGGKNETN